MEIEKGGGKQMRIAINKKLKESPKSTNTINK